MTRHRAWGFHLWYRVEVPEGTNIREAVEAYQAQGEWVETAEPQYTIKPNGSFNTISPPFTPNDPLFPSQWNLDNNGQGGGTADADIDLPEAWGLETGKPEVILAVMDTGVDTNHVDLRPNLWIGPSGERFGYNFFRNSNLINPGTHGTSITGILGAVSNNGILMNCFDCADTD